MAKDPAFLFYPNDWIGGTMGMTLEEKGAYMEVLMMQFNRGHMTEHMIGLTVGQLFGRIKDKFVQDESGLWYNERLDVEKEKRKKFVDSRRNNTLGENQYSKKKGKDEGHMTLHMDNENNVLNSLNKKGNGVIKSKTPKREDFNGLPEIKIGAAIQFFKIAKQTVATESDIKGLWEVFKIQNLDGVKFYNSEHDVYSHFLNWIKFQKLEPPDKKLAQNIPKPSDIQKVTQQDLDKYRKKPIEKNV